MAEKVRYNKIIDLLEHGKPVFSTSTVPNGSLDDLTYIADADYDAVIIEMEHEGFSFATLRSSLQVLLNRKRIAEKGNLQPDVVPMVRIPPNARERNQWVIKQALDMGVYGLVLPHLSTVDDAQAAVGQQAIDQPFRLGIGEKIACFANVEHRAGRRCRDRRLFGHCDRGGHRHRGEDRFRRVGALAAVAVLVRVRDLDL